MVTLSSLWFAIALTSVVIFFASAIMWMLLPHHKKDILFINTNDADKEADKEAAYIKCMNALDLKPGMYMYPGCDAKDYKTDEGKKRYSTGPWGTLTVFPGKSNFPMNLLKTFITFGVITIFVAYITGLSVGPGADYMQVFRVAGATAMLGHCMGGLTSDFFMGKPSRLIITEMMDKVVYALITAGMFASMWPAGKSVLDGMLINPG